MMILERMLSGMAVGAWVAIKERESKRDTEKSRETDRERERARGRTGVGSSTRLKLWRHRRLSGVMLQGARKMRSATCVFGGAAIATFAFRTCNCCTGIGKSGDTGFSRKIRTIEGILVFGPRREQNLGLSRQNSGNRQQKPSTPYFARPWPPTRLRPVWQRSLGQFGAEFGAEFGSFWGGVWVSLGRSLGWSVWGGVWVSLGRSLGRFGAEFGSVWGGVWVSLGRSLGQFGAEFGSVWGGVWVSLGRSLGQFGAEFGSVWGGVWVSFGQSLGQLSLGQFGAESGQFGAEFGSVWGGVYGVWGGVWGGVWVSLGQFGAEFG